MAGNMLVFVVLLAHFIASPIILVLRNRRLVEYLALTSSIIAGAFSISIAYSLKGVLYVELTPYLSLYVDRLSTIFLVVVNVLGSLIVLYSIGYMKSEEGYRRFYSLMAFFLGSMSLLVVSGSLLYLLLAWEAVGVCSSLLISYWWERPKARHAGLKAIVMTRVGDMALVLAVALAMLRGIYNIPEVLDTPLPPELRDTLPFLILLAAFAKSAQFPLHTWLPDAMEGPTPVSALIHAATMVKAGIYLVARFMGIIGASSLALGILLYTSLATMILAALGGLAASDIKRVLAFSTISSLSLMMLSLSVGQYGLAILYLVNHALFKALLFLSSGVLEHTYHTRDLRVLRGIGFASNPIEALSTVVGVFYAASIPPATTWFIKEGVFESLPFPEPSIEFLVSLVTILNIAFLIKLVAIPFIARGRRGGLRLEPYMHFAVVILLGSTIALPVIQYIVAGYLRIPPDTRAITSATLTGVALVSLVLFTLLYKQYRLQDLLSGSTGLLFETSMYIDRFYEYVGRLIAEHASRVLSETDRLKPYLLVLVLIATLITLLGVLSL
ncbi:NADH-quinone oxidoreductase subunit 5 family protein [Thermogladius sp. 4427co]|uniref:NADH-quinone oxidoreductase subunit 5 family protein n=1 Tax=Thermogladius sp. 4427co TaxID=3450718 RepID=UPI003F799B27